MNYNTRIKLSKLDVRNFKGIKELNLDTACDDLKVYGDNGTGKTTIYDAFLWCLFDKDSQGKASFEVRPIVDGEPSHNVKTEVTVTLDVNGQEIELSRTLEEKWVKKRGAEESELTGMSSSYSVNKVPYSKTKFQAFINNTLSEETFRRITSADYFFQLSRADMRKLLMDMAGEVPKEQLIELDPEVEIALTVMEKRNYSVDDLTAVVKAERKKLNSELNSIPARIDEISRNKPERINDTYIKKTLAEVEVDIENTDNLISVRAESLDVSREMTKKIAGIEKYIEDTKDQIRRQHNYKRTELSDAIESGTKYVREREEERQALKNKIKVAKDTIETVRKRLEAYRKQYSELRETGTKLNSEMFNGIPEGEDKCSYCGQKLPKDKMKELEAEALKVFESRKSQRLKQIKDDMAEIVRLGNVLKQQGTEAQESLEQMEEQVETVAKQIQAVNTTVSDLSGQLSKLPEELDDKAIDRALKDIPEVRDAYAKIAMLSEQVLPDAGTTELVQRKTELMQKRSDLEKELSVNERADEVEERIEELKKKQREYSTHLAKIERIKASLERLNRARAELLQDKINSMFSYVSFRLSKQNLNGGVEDDCEALVNGVPYSSNASRSEKIRAGMDVVRAMQRHAGISAVLFIDNAESATWFVEDMGCQIIKMYVSEEDKHLRWE